MTFSTDCKQILFAMLQSHCALCRHPLHINVFHPITFTVYCMCERPHPLWMPFGQKCKVSPCKKTLLYQHVVTTMSSFPGFIVFHFRLVVHAWRSHDCSDPCNIKQCSLKQLQLRGASYHKAVTCRITLQTALGLTWPLQSSRLEFWSFFCML